MYLKSGIRIHSATTYFDVQLSLFYFHIIHPFPLLLISFNEEQYTVYETVSKIYQNLLSNHSKGIL